MKLISKSVQRFQHRMRKLSSEKKFFIAALALCVLTIAIMFATFWGVTYPVVAAYVGLSIPSSGVHGSAQIDIISIAQSNGSGPYSAPEGRHYDVVRLRIKNIHTTPISIAPPNDIYVKNSQGKVSYLTPLALEDPFKSGIILPGESTEGELSFLVADGDHRKLYLESDWSGGAVSYLLQ